MELPTLEHLSAERIEGGRDVFVVVDDVLVRCPSMVASYWCRANTEFSGEAPALPSLVRGSSLLGGPVRSQLGRTQGCSLLRVIRRRR